MSLFETFAGKHPKLNQSPIAYGTAGFRNKSTELDSVVFRMGALAAIRSMVKEGMAVGLMITASHNPEEDNGVKIIDPFGEMLEPSWESIATDVANVDDTALKEMLSSISKSDFQNRKGLVFIARDTRKSSPQLAETASDGVKAVGGDLKNFGLLTTPQLHFIVHCFNRKGLYGEASEEGYYSKLSKAFMETYSHSNKISFNGKVVVDCANGVGSEKLRKLVGYIENNNFQVELCNTGNGILNHECGADFVKLYQRAPVGIVLNPNVRYASLDGDADRIVYYYLNPVSSKFCLIDGDKIAVLLMSYLKELLDKIGITSQLDFCVVQTAYANGNSTNYIKNVLKVEAACVPTGVKHLHHRAQQSDVAVYFESNGHGTALINDKTMKLIADSSNNKHKDHLVNFIDLINQTNGDAIADLLVVETILHNRNMSIHEWNQLYIDLPNRQLKVNVVDRNVIKTTHDETRCVTPSSLQEAIDVAVKAYGEKARSFIRPSGTEDIVRVYAEAETQEKADSLAEEVANIVKKQL